LTALALAVLAREVCVDETISALVLAFEAEEGLQVTSLCIIAEEWMKEKLLQ
jgi:hypothetical protein